ncbi:MAG TPA: cobalamin-binding protein, partial [Candidatus Cloacimonadota bacterium]|nr:cobalamin-binding protein [Candidatus Cloacimonadota bacterium]
DSLSNIISRKGWQEIPAIKNGLIYTEKNLDPDLIQRAGPRARLGIKRLNELFMAWANDQRL